jgi:hypothetical protein
MGARLIGILIGISVGWGALPWVPKFSLSLWYVLPPQARGEMHYEVGREEIRSAIELLIATQLVRFATDDET